MLFASRNISVHFFPWFFKHQWHELTSACVEVNEHCAVVLTLPWGNYCTEAFRGNDCMGAIRESAGKSHPQVREQNSNTWVSVMLVNVGNVPGNWQNNLSSCWILTSGSAPLLVMTHVVTVCVAALSLETEAEVCFQINHTCAHLLGHKTLF